MSVGPYGKAEDAPGILVHKQARVSYAILILRQAAVSAHVHDKIKVAPGLAAVRRTLHAHVDVCLEVSAVGVTHIVCGDERAGVGGYQCRDAECGYSLGRAADVDCVSSGVDFDAEEMNERIVLLDFTGDAVYDHFLHVECVG